MTSEPLLPRVALGDTDAIRACIARHGSLVWSIARKLSPTPSDAEDAVQEIFLDLWKNAARFDAHAGSEQVFVAMIARRRLIDRSRSRKRRLETEPISEPRMQLTDATIGSDAETCAEAKTAVRAIGELRADHQEVLLLSITHGLSHDEVATRMNLPLGTVKTYARRALAQVRDALGSARSGEKAVSS